MEKILILQNKHWFSEYKGIIPRFLLTVLEKKISLKEIQIILGVRRSGKSTLFKLLINSLTKKGIRPKEILYINIEDPVYIDAWKNSKNIYSIIETAEKITGQKIKYLFLDEIQSVKNWESFIKSAYDMETFKKIFITGSNSFLLKSDYSKLLSGRYVYDTVYPLSFKEILSYKGLNSYMDILKETPLVLSITEELLKYGSFPEVFKTDDEELKRSQLLSYYETILFKDCLENKKLKDIKLLENLSLYLISNPATLYSYNSISRFVDSNENTVREYINSLEKAFLFYEVKKFSYKIKEQIRNNKKAYIADNGLINAIAFKFSENKGKLFENLVFTEFLKNGIKEIYYYQNRQNKKECDFVIKKRGNYIGIQVSYELTDANIDRETKGISFLMDELSLKEGYIVTFNQEKNIDKKIKAVPFCKFLFEVI
ncbi:MAG: ATP-binding protein [Elusimicrobia bacterium]|nr:ATP-binding protein [Elusimicrobiota bacterium]